MNNISNEILYYILDFLSLREILKLKIINKLYLCLCNYIINNRYIKYASDPEWVAHNFWILFYFPPKIMNDNILEEIVKAGCLPILKKINIQKEKLTVLKFAILYNKYDIFKNFFYTNLDVKIIFDLAYYSAAYDRTNFLRFLSSFINIPNNIILRGYAHGGNLEKLKENEILIEDWNDLLCSASHSGSLDIVKWITQKNKDINLNSALGCAVYSNNEELIEYLIDKGACDLNAALICAVDFNKFSLFQKFLIKSQYDEYTIFVCVERACRNGNVEIIRNIVKTYPEKINFSFQKLAILAPKEVRKEIADLLNFKKL